MKYKTVKSLPLKYFHHKLVEEKWRDIPKPLHITTFSAILNRVGYYMSLELAKGKPIQIPSLGKVTLYITDRFYKKENNKVYTNISIDWKKTNEVKKLYGKDVPVIRHEGEYAFKLIWNKYFKNCTYYKLTLKDELAKLIYKYTSEHKIILPYRKHKNKK